MGLEPNEGRYGAELGSRAQRGKNMVQKVEARVLSQRKDNHGAEG